MILNVGALSYIAAGLAFLFLTVSLLISWRGRYQGALLAFATLVSTFWSVMMAYAAGTGRWAPALDSALEIFRSSAWFLFLGALLTVPNGSNPPNRKLQFVISGLLLFCLVVLLASIYIHAGASAGVWSGRLYFVVDIASRVIMAVAGMVLVEQLFRNTHPEQRWGIKFLCLGVGGIFAYDFFLYSDAMLFRHIDVNLWAARGVVNALVVPLIIVSAARNPQWSLDVHVSRGVVFRTATLLGAGIYLLVMAAAGYYIRVFGGNWGTVLQTAFLFGALIILMTMLFSGTVRAKLKVFLSKHFFSYRYDYREEWLRFTRALSAGEPEGRLCESAIKAIAGLVESPAGALWLRKDTGEYLNRAHWNMPASHGIESVDGSLLQYLENRQWVINLDEYESTPEIYVGLTVPDWLLSIPRAWLIVPLFLHERLLGFMVLAHSRSHVSFNWEISDLLKTAAGQAASYLAQQQAAEALVVARQFESFNRMSAFVVHDLKNLVAQLSLMLSNAEKHKHNPEFQEDMLSTVDNSVEKMNRLLAQLRRGSSGEVDDTEVDLARVLEEVVKEKATLKPTPVLKSIKPGLTVTADRERLLRVVGHVVQNASEATRYDGKVEIRLVLSDGCAMIEIEDNGKGMDEQFIRERLFRPFDSTKGSGMGIGAHECQEYIRELGGHIEVKSELSKGTLFRIALPLSTKNEKIMVVSQEGEKA